MGVAQGLFGVEAQADVAAVGRRRAVARARALVVTAAATHGARRPAGPAGPGAVGCGRKGFCDWFQVPNRSTSAPDVVVFPEPTSSGHRHVALFQRGIDWAAA